MAAGRPAEPPGQPLAERDAALQALAAALHAAGSGGRVALVGGEAGIGKTSLLRAAGAAWRAAGGSVWWGACDALQTPHPLAPLLDMARDIGRDGVAVGAAMGVALGGPRPALFEAVLDALRQAAPPVLVVVEDAHWADDATLDWLKHLGRRIERARAVLAISYRDDEVGAAHPLRRVFGELPPAAVLRLPVPPLSPQAVDALARQAGRPAAGLHAATRGNAFFVTEVLREGGLPPGSVPASVQDLVLSRYARLPAGAQALLRGVAMVPGRCERWLVDALLSPALADLDAALGSGLLRAEDGHLAYRHELGRLAVASSLSAAVAQDLHARLLAALSAPGRATPAARLVHHALQAGDRDAISRHAPQAAADAAERSSHREAHAQWQLALREGRPADDAERERWLEAAQAAAAVAGDSTASLRAGQALEALATARGDHARAALQRSRQANAHIGLLAHREASAASQAALAMVSALPASPQTELHRAFIWANEALIRMLERDCVAGVARAREAIALAEAAGDETSLAGARIALGASLLFIDFPAGRALLEEVLARRRAAGAPRPVVAALQMLGSGLGELMHLGAAEGHLREAVALARAHEFDAFRDYSSAWLALCLLWRGRWDEAAAVAAVPLQQADGMQMSRLMALLAVGRLRARRGDPGAAEALDEALALAAPSATLQRVGPTHAARAEAAWLRGDLPAVRAEVAAGLPLAQDKCHPWFIGELAYWGWRAGMAGLDTAGAAEPCALQIAGRWQAAAEAWQALGCPYEQARALAEGDAGAQQQALALFDALGARPAAEALRRQLREAGVRGVARGARAATRSHPCGLTVAEAQVLRLLAQGLRNAEIAARLHRSVRTVDHHVAAVLAKLAADTRQAAVQRAADAGWWGEPP